MSSRNNADCWIGAKIKRLTSNTILILILTTGLIFLTSAPLVLAKKRKSSLAAKQAEVNRLRNQIGSLDRSLRQIAKKYTNLSYKLADTKAKLRKSEQELAAAQAKEKFYHEALNRRIQAIYRHGQIDFLMVIVGSKTFDEFLLRTDMLKRVGKQDAKLLFQAIQARKDVEEKQKVLADVKATQAAILKQLKAQQREMESKLATQRALLKSKTGEIIMLERQRQVSYASARFHTSGFVFPVAGPCTFSNTWGAPRGGGRRRHKGTDIFALRGTPCVACVSGRVSLSSGGNGGIMLYLYGNDGHTYFYAHLNGYAAGIRNGSSVNAGKVIAYVGNTGNARGGAAHLHFEIHPNGRGAINPYSILRSAYR